MHDRIHVRRNRLMQSNRVCPWRRIAVNDFSCSKTQLELVWPILEASAYLPCLDEVNNGMLCCLFCRVMGLHSEYRVVACDAYKEGIVLYL